MANTFANIEQAVEEATDNNESSSGGGDYEELAWVNIAPTSIITGTITDLVYTGVVSKNGSIVEQQKNEDNTDGSWAFVLENPGVEKGTIFQNVDKPSDGFSRTIDGASSTDYRVFDTNDDGFEYSYDADGNTKGVSNHLTDKYSGEEVDSFDEDKIIIYIGSLAGQFMTRILDANGGMSAYVNDDGENTRGLIEYPSSWDNGPGEDGLYPRVARYPELRTDVEGEEIFLFLKWRNGSNRAMEGHVGLMSDLRGEMEDLDDGEALSVEAIQRSFLGRIRDSTAVEYDSTLAWHESPQDSGSSDEGPSGSFDIGSDGSGGDSQFTESEQEFITQCVGVMEKGDTVADTFGDFSATVEENMSKNVDGEGLSLPNTTDADELASAINSSVGGQ